MRLSMFSPTTPHTGRIDSISWPRGGEFDGIITACVVKSALNPPSFIGCVWEIDKTLAPTYGELTLGNVNSPVLPPLVPCGGVVGKNIDRRII